MATKAIKKEIVLEQEHGVDVKKSIATIIKNDKLSDSEKLAEISQALKTKPTGISVVGTLLRSERLMDTTTMSLTDKLGAIILGGLFVDTLKNSYDSLVKQLENTSLEDVTKKLIEEGSIKAGETPVITVIDRSGAKHSCSLSTSSTSKFDMDSFKDLASDPDIFDGLPDEYKEIKIKGSAFFKKLFTAKALGAYEKYFSLSSETLTKLKKEKVATDKESE